MLPTFPPVDCSEKELEDELVYALSVLPLVLRALFDEEFDQGEVHTLGHVVATCVMAAHGYHALNFRVDNPSYVCRFIAKIPGLELHS